jgi:hypothetical protein
MATSPRIGTSRINVDYVDGSAYHVGTKAQDYTSEVLGILTELVNARKLSSDIATTKQYKSFPTARFSQSTQGATQ